jgi:protein-L-isoaspartate(D-aspartate) O-methyltransferase
MIFMKKSEFKDAYSRPRQEMVEKQIAARGIRDPRVLAAMKEVPRHLFVPPEFGGKAYADCPLPIGERQTISQPFMVALMTELLELKGNEKVLEIGSGSGYQTAVLCRLAEQVYSVERIPSLLIKARKALESLDIHNVALKVFDGTMGWKDYAPYDVILVTAGGPEVPKPLMNQLKPGGRLVMPIGGRTQQVLHRLVKTDSGIRETTHSLCTFVSLIGEYGWKENSNV